MCRSGPFKSPEELGTHCALCNGTQQALHHPSAGGGARGGGRRRLNSVDELVRMLTVSMEHAPPPGPADLVATQRQRLQVDRDGGEVVETVEEMEDGEEAEEDDEDEEGGAAQAVSRYACGCACGVDNRPSFDPPPP
jgi:hypothetical protein